jgi:hypothetical protein
MQAFRLRDFAVRALSEEARKTAAEAQRGQHEIHLHVQHLGEATTACILATCKSCCKTDTRRWRCKGSRSSVHPTHATAHPCRRLHSLILLDIGHQGFGGQH